MKSYTKKAVEILKNIFVENVSTGRDELGHAWRDSENRQIIAGAYYAFRLDDPAPILEGDPTAFFNSDKVFKPFFEKDAFGNEYMRINCPTKKELEEFIREKRQTWHNATGEYPKSVMYDFGENLPLVNAYFLKKMLEVLHKPMVYCLNSRQCMVAPLYFKGENGDGALAPIRKDGK